MLVGSDLTQEELKLIQTFAGESISGAKIAHFGTEGVKSVSQDADADKILKRKSKTSNLNGVEKLGIQPFSGETDAEVVLVFRGGRAELPELKGKKVFGFGVFNKNETQNYTGVLPGAAYSEKDGTIFNFSGVEQKFKRAVMPPGKSKYLSEVFMIWKSTKNKEGAA